VLSAEETGDEGNEIWSTRFGKDRADQHHGVVPPRGHDRSALARRGGDVRIRELHGRPEPRLRFVSRGLTSCGGDVIKGARLVWGPSNWTIHPTVSRLVRPEGLERSTDRLLRCCSIKRHRVQN
jgi:hypothetical protein